MPIVAREQQARPGRPALGVVGPLHLVEHEHLARARCHLDRAADDRGRVVDSLLAGDEADGVLPQLGREPAVCLLREHAERPRVDTAAALLQHLERVVGLAGVRRAEVRHDRLRLNAPCRQADLDCTFRAGYCGVCAGRASALMALGTARAPGPAASLSASAGHEMRVAAVGWRARRTNKAGDTGNRRFPASGSRVACRKIRRSSGEEVSRDALPPRHLLPARPSGSGAKSYRTRGRRRRGRCPSARARSSGTTRPARRARCSRSG